MKKLLSSQRMITFIISLSLFMEAVDGNIINTAIPTISHSLQVEPTNLKITLISYLLSLAIFIPISGWLADKYGTKKVFISALFIFTLSSLWCGFASNLTELSFARFCQGLGGALGLPVGRLIIVRTFGRENFIVRMNQVVTIGALGIMLGPVIGGVIVQHVSWHWIFWVNIPVGLFNILLAKNYLPKEKPVEAIAPLDKFGFLLFGLALAGFTFSLSALSETSIGATTSFAVILISLVLFAIYFFHSRHVTNPIIKTELLRIKTFQISVTSNLITRLGFGGVPFLVPLLLQIGLGFSAELSGLLLAPMALGVLFAKSGAIRLLRFFGYKRVLIVNTWAAATIIFLFNFVSSHTPIYLIGVLTFLFGLMISLQYGSMNSLAYANLSSKDLSAGTSIMGTIQQLAQSFGVAISALFIRFFSFVTMSDVLTTTILHHTFIAIGAITALASIIFLRLSPGDGQEMIGY